MKRRVVIGTSIFLVSQSTAFCDNKSSVLDVSKSLKFGYPAIGENEALTFLKEINKVKVYCPKNTSDSAIYRIATTEIRAPIDEITSIISDHQMRKTWDKNFCFHSQVVEANDKEKLNYIRGYSGIFAPPRDYVFSMKKLTGALVGSNDFRSVVYACVDASDAIPNSSWAVRGKMNSLLILEPKSVERTQATYIVSIVANGWMPDFISVLSADAYVSTLSMLKKEVERTNSEDEKLLSVDEAARLRFERKQILSKEASITSIVDDVGASKENLLSTEKILERKLKDISAAEKSDGIDMSDLKHRIQRDLKNVKDRLKTF